MIFNNESRRILAGNILILFLLSGCAAAKTTLKYNQSEIELIPASEIQKVLSPAALNETVKVRANNIDGSVVVKGFIGDEYVLVTNKLGQQVSIPSKDITEIDRIRHIKTSDKPGGKGKSSTAETVGETLIYAPLIPFSVAVAPALRASGLDAKKNAQDVEKARLVYVGMSKEDLMKNLGEPREEYFCGAKGKLRAHEVWIFEEHKVLRGARAIFIDSEKNTVYHTSYSTTKLFR